MTSTPRTSPTTSSNSSYHDIMRRFFASQPLPPTVIGAHGAPEATDRSDGDGGVTQRWAPIGRGAAPAPRPPAGPLGRLIAHHPRTPDPQPGNADVELGWLGRLIARYRRVGARSIEFRDPGHQLDPTVDPLRRVPAARRVRADWSPPGREAGQPGWRVSTVYGDDGVTTNLADAAGRADTPPSGVTRRAEAEA